MKTPVPKLSLRCRLSELVARVRAALPAPTPEPASCTPAESIAYIERQSGYLLAGMATVLALTAGLHGCVASPPTRPADQERASPSAGPQAAELAKK